MGVCMLQSLKKSVILKVTNNGKVSSFAPLSNNAFPIAIAIFHATGDLYVTCFGAHVIAKITPKGIVSIFAGCHRLSGSVDGIGTKAQFNYPWGIDIDQKTGCLYVADHRGHQIRKITPDGDVSTVVGTGVSGFMDGDSSIAQFSSPTAVCFHPPSDDIYIGDYKNTRIRKISSAGIVTTFAGTDERGYIDGDCLSATFTYPWTIVVDVTDDSLLIVDFSSTSIRRIAKGVVSTIVLPGSNSLFNQPCSIVIDHLNHICYVSETTQIKKFYVL